jgi:S1-C subfamily serine protease
MISVLAGIALAGSNPFAHSDESSRNGAVSTLGQSLVRISVTTAEPNFRTPWNPGNVGGGTGAGFVIAGKRVMTNAHVVSNARFLTVDRENDPKRYIARVAHVAHDCDLAVLELEDASFFEGTPALDFGGIPALESAVSVYGYPVGGERLSVTRGVVSRIDFQLYSHSGADSHLAIQIDAAINPGNSGGPVMQGGRVVGVAFQGYSGAVAQNVGYMIPTPVVRRFLKDVADGRYDRYVDLAIDVFPTQNPAMRRALGLADDDRGVMVASVVEAGCSFGKLKVGDVLLEIDGMPIASDGFVGFDGTRVEMNEVVERKFKGDRVKFKIWRDRKPEAIEITLDTVEPYLMQAYGYDRRAPYMIFAGLIFQPLSRNFMEAWEPDDLRLRYLYEYYLQGEIYRERPEIVVLSGILPDPANAYLAEFRNGVVETINGLPIRTLADAAKAFERPAERHVVKMVGAGRPLVIEAKAAAAAAGRIRDRYNVVEDRWLGEAQ